MSYSIEIERKRIWTRRTTRIRRDAKGRSLIEYGLIGYLGSDLR